MTVGCINEVAALTGCSYEKMTGCSYEKMYGRFAGRQDIGLNNEVSGRKAGSTVFTWCTKVIVF